MFSVYVREAGPIKITALDSVEVPKYGADDECTIGNRSTPSPLSLMGQT